MPATPLLPEQVAACKTDICRYYYEKKNSENSLPDPTINLDDFLPASPSPRELEAPGNDVKPENPTVVPTEDPVKLGLIVAGSILGLILLAALLLFGYRRRQKKKQEEDLPVIPYVWSSDQEESVSKMSICSPKSSIYKDQQGFVERSPAALIPPSPPKIELPPTAAAVLAESNAKSDESIPRQFEITPPAYKSMLSNSLPVGVAAAASGAAFAAAMQPEPESKVSFSAQDSDDGSSSPMSEKAARTWSPTEYLPDPSSSESNSVVSATEARESIDTIKPIIVEPLITRFDTTPTPPVTPIDPIQSMGPSFAASLAAVGGLMMLNDQDSDETATPEHSPILATTTMNQQVGNHIVEIDQGSQAVAEIQQESTQTVINVRDAETSSTVTLHTETFRLVDEMVPKQFARELMKNHLVARNIGFDKRSSLSSSNLYFKGNRWSIQEDEISDQFNQEEEEVQEFLEKVRSFGPNAKFDLAKFIKKCQECNKNFEIEQFLSNLSMKNEMQWENVQGALKNSGVGYSLKQSQILAEILCGDKPLEILQLLVESRQQGLVDTEYLVAYYFGALQVQEKMAQSIRSLSSRAKFDLESFTQKCQEFNPNFKASEFLNKISSVAEPQIINALESCKVSVSGNYFELMQLLCGDYNVHLKVLQVVINAMNDCGVDAILSYTAYSKSLLGNATLSSNEIMLATSLFYKELSVLCPSCKFDLLAFFEKFDEFSSENHSQVLYQLSNSGNLESRATLVASLVAMGLDATQSDICLQALVKDDTHAHQVLKCWQRLCSIIGIEAFVMYCNVEPLKLVDNLQDFANITIANLISLQNGQFDVYFLLKEMRQIYPEYRLNQFLANAAQLHSVPTAEWIDFMFNGLKMEHYLSKYMLQVLFGANVKAALQLMSVYSSLVNPVLYEEAILTCLYLSDIERSL